MGPIKFVPVLTGMRPVIVSTVFEAETSAETATPDVTVQRFNASTNLGNGY